jgi:hypothetical protein
MKEELAMNVRLTSKTGKDIGVLEHREVHDVGLSLLDEVGEQFLERGCSGGEREMITGVIGLSTDLTN